MRGGGNQPSPCQLLAGNIHHVGTGILCATCLPTIFTGLTARPTRLTSRPTPGNRYWEFLAIFVKFPVFLEFFTELACTVLVHFIFWLIFIGKKMNLRILNVIKKSSDIFKFLITYGIHRVPPALQTIVTFNY